MSEREGKKVPNNRIRCSYLDPTQIAASGGCLQQPVHKDKTLSTCTWKVHLSRSTLDKPVKEKSPVYKLKRQGWEVGTHPRQVPGK